MLTINTNNEIISTAGPTMKDVKDFELAIESGCTNFRIHLGLRHRDQLGYFRNLRIAEKNLGVKCDVIADFPTSRPRLDGFIEKLVEENELISFVVKQKNDNDIILTGLEKIIQQLKLGEHILFRDGKVNFKIIEIDIKNCRIVTKCIKSVIELMKGGSGVFPDSNIEFSPIVEEDKLMLIKMKNEGLIPDWVCLSFAASKEQIDMFNSFSVNMWGERKRIISKIEHKNGILNADEIIDYSDGIMIGRGDLALYINPIKVPKVQAMLMKKIISKKKVAIIATEFLEWFANDGVIHRPELTDIAVAVRQGANALMLAMESCNCERPFECIKLMKSIMNEEMKPELNLI